MQLGLIGNTLSHSFSKTYFEEKFKKLELPSHSYSLFELDDISDFTELLKKNPEIKGLNATIPYKEGIIPFLDELDEEAKEIGAVNTIKISIKDGKQYLKGYNTDVFGFRNSIKPFLLNTHERALILGTGGASKAIDYVLKNLGIQTLFVSRNPIEGQISYTDINEYVMKYHKLIVNCTPLGTAPNVAEKPNIPYKLINDSHTLMDLVYNPKKTEFMKLGKAEGAVVLNGLSMLQQQADRAWEIFNA
ncbi:shikimate dehydrogenase [Flavobacteriales bacterium]|nr:shikimate dehydrogenase [Flavobacteriales bacterium]